MPGNARTDSSARADTRWPAAGCPRASGQIVAPHGASQCTDYNAAMPSATDFTLSSTLPAHALLGRLLAVRVSLLAG